MEKEQRAEDQYDLVNGTLVVFVGIAKDDGHTPLAGELCSPVSRSQTGGTGVQTHALASAKVPSASKAEKDAAEQRVKRESAECKSASISALKERRPGDGLRRKRSVEREKDVPFREVRGHGRRRKGCHEPDTAVSFARSAESSSDSGSLQRVRGSETPSEEYVPAALIRFRSPPTLQEDLTTMWEWYARPGFPKDVIVYLGEVGNETVECLVAGSLEQFLRQAMDEMVETGTVDVRGGMLR